MAGLATPPEDVRAVAKRLSTRRWLALWRAAFALIRRAAPNETRWLVVSQMVSSAASVAQLAVAAYVLRILTDGERVSVGALGLPLAVGALLFGLGSLVSVLTNELGILLTEKVARVAHEQVLEVALAVELEAYETPGFHDRLVRAQNQTDQHAWDVVYGSGRLVGGLAGAAAVGIALIVLAPAAAVVAFLAYVPMWLALRRNNEASYEFAFERTSLERERSYLQQLLTGRHEAAEIRLFGSGRYLEQRYRELYDTRLLELAKLARRRLRRSLVANVFTVGIATVSMVLLVYLVSSGRLSVARAGVAVLALTQLRGRLSSLVDAAAAIYRAGRFLDDHLSFTELAPVAAAGQRGSREAPSDVAVYRLDNVSFAYPDTDRTVLREVSLQLNRGDVVALVGENGSGKSSLAKLLCGLYQPTSGTIWWDDVDLATCHRASVFQGVGAIFQDFVAYQLSLADNVALGDVNRREDVGGLNAAAERSGARQLVERMGWQTRLSREYEGGTELSGGQWQRVALARAFFREAPLLVLDEPTAALDPRAEADLFESLRGLYRGRTVLVISHRFSTVRTADWIYVLDEGHIIEQGNHDTLMALQGKYANLFTIQAAAYH